MKGTERLKGLLTLYVKTLINNAFKRALAVALCGNEIKSVTTMRHKICS